MTRLLRGGAALLLAGTAALVAPVTAAATSAAPAAATGTTYYVDAASGNDAAAGTTSATAWRTLGKVDATTFAPGDRILLHAGQKWTGQLWPKGSGADGQPIEQAIAGVEECRPGFAPRHAGCFRNAPPSP